MRTVRVTTPEGLQWSVRVAWLARWRGLYRRFDDWWVNRKSGDGLFPPAFVDVEGLIFALLAPLVWLVVTGLLGLIVVPLLLMVVDAAVVVVVLVAAVGARVLFRRPWTVEATRGDGVRLELPVVGYRAAARRRDELAGQLRAGTLRASRHL